MVSASCAEKGVTPSLPFATTVLPASIAWQAWFITSTKGPFQGVISPTTPQRLVADMQFLGKAKHPREPCECEA